MRPCNELATSCTWKQLENLVKVAVGHRHQMRRRKAVRAEMMKEIEKNLELKRKKRARKIPDKIHQQTECLRIMLTLMLWITYHLTWYVAVCHSISIYFFSKLGCETILTAFSIKIMKCFPNISLNKGRICGIQKFRPFH